jgi:4-amino-4-deoxy-L-arabinose transferase-like glycosyltransferase
MMTSRGRIDTERFADLATLVGLLLLAALLRLPDLATRGTWDGDQGHDMLMLRDLVRDGVVPLLGPPTSIGDFHHGALYYYLLGPAAALTGGGSPLAVVAFIALTGIAAVGVTWWLARSMGGPIAGLVAGLLMAISISAIDESTFIWNPNPIPLASALALAGAWRAWTTRDARWWLLAAAATATVMQLHVLGTALFPVVAALFVADLRRRPRDRTMRFITLAGLAIIAVTYVPLVVNELTTDFSETRAALDYLAGGRTGSDLNPLLRIVVVGIRILTWPLVGLVVDAGIVAVLAAMIVVALAIWLARGPASAARTAARWLGLGLAWSTVSLALAATSLATVVRGLPNDHYHAFADPMVFALVGLAVAALWRWDGPRPRARAGTSPADTRGAPPAAVVGPVLAAVLVVGLVGWNVTRLPPATHPDGGFPAARLAAERIGAATGDRPIALRSIPDFKSTEAYAYPLVLDGRRPVPEAQATALVVICDALFEEVVGAACGGPAETAALGPTDRFAALADRWEAAPGRTISVYLAREP